MKTAKKPYWEMNQENLRETTRAYDRDQRGRGRWRIGLDMVRVQISLEPSLLRQTDATAKRLLLTRSQLIARCLREGLKRRG